MQLRRPPLGVMPKYLWEEKILEERLEELNNAFYRYIEDKYPIHQKLVDEYNELCQRLNPR